MTTAVFAIQNDFALRYGPACTSPTSFLALRLKGLQKNQPELVSAYASSASGSSSSSSPIHQLQVSYPTRLSSSYPPTLNSANKNNNNNNQNNFSGNDNNNNQQPHPLRSSVAASSIHPYQSPSSSSLMDQSSYVHHMAAEQREHEWDRLAQQQQQKQRQQVRLADGANIRTTRSVEYSQNFSSRHSSPDAVDARVGGGGSGRNDTHNTNNKNITNNDIDSQPLPAPGALSSTTTLAKALSTDPEAHVPPEAISMAECYICNRRFDVTRLNRHITACQKSAAAAAKRKEFDAQEVRVKKLYENDPLTAAKVLKQIEKEEELAATGKAPQKKSTWRKKSAELNNAVGRGTAGGGPNPIPVIDDRVPCPGCGKKFAEETAARHIPSCLARQKRSSFR